MHQSKSGWVGGQRLEKYLTEEVRAWVGLGRGVLFICLRAFLKCTHAQTKAKLNESKVKKHNGACLVPSFIPTFTHTPQPTTVTCSFGQAGSILTL